MQNYNPNGKYNIFDEITDADSIRGFEANESLKRATKESFADDTQEEQDSE